MSKSNTKRQEEFTVLGEIVLVDDKKKLQLNSSDHYNTLLNKIPVGKKVVVTVSTDVTIRSRSQLAYFMVLCGYIADYTGYTTKEMYPILIEDVYPPTEVMWKGEVRKVRKSVSDVAKMPSYEMQLLVQYALEMCNELGIVVPTKEELGYLSD